LFSYKKELKDKIYNMENLVNVDYLRLSLTDRCNLNCIYCTPIQKSQFLNREEVLSYEEMARAVGLFVKAGVRKLRLTGGEPLIKKNIAGLIEMFEGIEGLKEISMTTNGVCLKGHAARLKEAGLARLNISIDTLKREKFELITGFDRFDDVWAGIMESLEARLDPVKLNVILMKGINDDEILDFARLTLKYPLIIRFIEFFPTNKRSLKLSDVLVETRVLKEKISAHFGSIDSVSGILGNGPAEYYKLKGSKGAVGFINSSSANFCGSCNRIRLDCAGKVRPCLFCAPTHDLRPLLRGAQDDGQVLEYLKDVFKIKSKFRKDISAKHQLEMSSIGG